MSGGAGAGAGSGPEALQVLQSMIDVSAERLDGLRTHCATSAELTQQEIRTLEGKLIKLFSRQLVTKIKCKQDDSPAELRNIPSLAQWLQVVGLRPDSVKMVCSKIRTLESLQEKSERELKTILGDAREEEARRLCRAMQNLKKYTEVLNRGGGGGAVEAEMALYWDSWDQHNLHRGSPRPYNRHARASVPSEDALLHLPNGTPPGGCAPLSHQYLMSPPTLAGRNASPGKTVLPLPLSRSASSIAPQQSVSTPPPSPRSPHQFLSTSISIQNAKGKVAIKFPTTPPAKRKHQTGLPPPALLNDVPPLTKSKSHESQLGVKMDGETNGTETPNKNHSNDASGQGRGRLATEPGVPSSPLAPCSPIRSPPYRGIHGNTQYNQSQNIDTDDKGPNVIVPRSPRTPVTRGMCHYIAHRFTKTFQMMATCDFCEKQLFLGAGLKCKECKYKCHRDCESKVPPSCGLPPELIDEFKKQLMWDKLDGSNFHNITNSPSSGRSPQHASNSIVSSIHRMRKKSHHTLNANVPSFPGGPDSSSNTSSCNSSTPSSPALVSSGVPPQTPHTPRTPHSTISIPPHNPPPGPILTHNRQQFNFPDIKKWPPVDTGSGGGSSSSAGQGDSERTVSLSGSASEDSERTPGGRTDSLDGDTLHRNESAKWPRQNSLSMKEWDIPFDELDVGEAVGTGRFGTVYRGSWHGDVAVKLLNMHNLDDEAALESFKLEVATFRKTRHENLVLFMGACMKPPRLAIVTSLCKGLTLYTHIHLRKDKFNMNKTTIVAQQISQGMGYLHARGIVHKDLKSKNIFLENGKVVITDFGLFSVTKLCFGNSAGDSLGIPAGWLCYLAPELVRGLRPRQTRHTDDLPFSKASDVYAFGTVWYELLCGEWPFKGQPPEAVIWQVGKGVKQTLANLQASRDVKDILMLCWSYRVTERPDFGRLLSTLEKLPRKRLARSPSHPVHLSRSAESVF